jgi:ribosomal protein S18 acetylase RimI-like enzyme
MTSTGFNWEIRRWDGWIFHRERPFTSSRLAALVHLWEDSAGLVVGAVHPEGSGNATLQLHPNYRHIESKMIGTAVQQLSIATDDGQHRIDTFVFEYDTPRQRLLEEHGFRKTSEVYVTRRLSFDSRTLPAAEPADGYTIRSTCPEDADYQLVADVINAGFGRTSHTAAEVRAFMTGSPSFRHDLDLVAEAGSGSFAAYVGLTFDEMNNRGIVEPVCTHPEHLRRGLARALIQEGLRRLKALGTTDVYVDTGDMVPANRLYESVGFTEAYASFAWRKVW